MWDRDGWMDATPAGGGGASLTKSVRLSQGSGHRVGCVHIGARNFR